MLKESNIPSQLFLNFAFHIHLKTYIGFFYFILYLHQFILIFLCFLKIKTHDNPKLHHIHPLPFPKHQDPLYILKIPLYYSFSTHLYIFRHHLQYSYIMESIDITNPIFSVFFPIPDLANLKSE